MSLLIVVHIIDIGTGEWQERACSGGHQPRQSMRPDPITREPGRHLAILQEGGHLADGRRGLPGQCVCARQELAIVQEGAAIQDDMP